MTVEIVERPQLQWFEHAASTWAVHPTTTWGGGGRRPPPGRNGMQLSDEPLMGGGGARYVVGVVVDREPHRAAAEPLCR